MSKVVLSMSLDGFATGPNVRESEPMGDGGERGVDVARQLLRADLLDEVYLHLSPFLLGSGTRLFDGEQADLIPLGEAVTGTVTHLRFRVRH